MSDPWTTYIIDLIVSSCPVVTRQQKCNWRFFVILGLGELNNENPLKGPSSVPVTVNRGEEEYWVVGFYQRVEELQ